MPERGPYANAHADMQWQMVRILLIFRLVESPSHLRDHPEARLERASACSSRWCSVRCRISSVPWCSCRVRSKNTSTAPTRRRRGGSSR